MRKARGGTVLALSPNVCLRQNLIRPWENCQIAGRIPGLHVRRPSSRGQHVPSWLNSRSACGVIGSAACFPNAATGPIHPSSNVKCQSSASNGPNTPGSRPPTRELARAACKPSKGLLFVKPYRHAAQVGDRLTRQPLDRAALHVGQKMRKVENQQRRGLMTFSHSPHTSAEAALACSPNAQKHG